MLRQLKREISFRMRLNAVQIPTKPETNDKFPE